MALVIADRVKETTDTASTGAYTLAGAQEGFQSFAAVGDGNTTYYVCTDGTDFEVAIGTYTASGTTLSRDTILESSNSDSAVDWSAGTKDIFVTVPAEKYLVRDASGNVSLTGNLSVTGTVDGVDIAARDAVLTTTTNTANAALPKAGGTMTGELQVNARLDVGTGTQNDSEVRIYKADNNVSDHIQFYNGTTRVGEIGCEDTTWFRFNQETSKNLYTPRAFRIDGGLLQPSTIAVHEGDTNTYIQFHSNDQWRVVCGGNESLEVRNGVVNVDMLEVGGTDVISSSRQLQNIASINTTTRNSIRNSLASGGTYNTIGTYTVAGRSYSSGGSGNVNPNTTLGGSSLKEAFGNGRGNLLNVIGNNAVQSAGCSGTWRQMTHYGRFSVGNYTNFALWVRIS
jgi:hypothetical protein